MSTAALTVDFPSLLERVHCNLRRDVKLGRLSTDLTLKSPSLNLRPSAVLRGDANDVAEDLFHLMGHRRHLRAYHPLSVGQLLEVDPLVVLNHLEMRRLHTYVNLWSRLEARCDWNDLAVGLSDEPDGGWTTWSATSNAIPTLRRASGLIASPAAHRAFLLRELYAAMGFASFPELAGKAKVPVYHVHRLGIPQSQMRRALGNSQHVAQVGAFAACALACICKS